MSAPAAAAKSGGVTTSGFGGFFALRAPRPRFFSFSTLRQHCRREAVGRQLVDDDGRLALIETRIRARRRRRRRRIALLHVGWRRRRLAHGTPSSTSRRVLPERAAAGSPVRVLSRRRRRRDRCSRGPRPSLLAPGTVKRISDLIALAADDDLRRRAGHLASTARAAGPSCRTRRGRAKRRAPRQATRRARTAARCARR